MKKTSISRMYKRVIALMLAFVMVIGMVPVTAMAETENDAVYCEVEIASAVLVENAKANSQQLPVRYDNDGGAEWAFDDIDSHWWHSRYQDWNQKAEHEVDYGKASAEQPIWIQTGFDRAALISKVTYATRKGGNGGQRAKDYTISVANLEDPTAEPTDEDFEVIKTGVLENTGDEQVIKLDSTVLATHVRLTFTSTYTSSEVAARKIRVFELQEVDVNELMAYNASTLAANAKANSEQIPAAYTNDGGAAWAFDEAAHWWHSRYTNWNQKAEHESANGQPSADNPIWIQTGFDREWFVDYITYLPRSGNAYGRMHDYSISVANMEDPTQEPADGDFKVVKTGSLENVAEAQTITLDRITRATHVRITVTSVYANGGTPEVAAQNIAFYGYYGAQNKYASDIEELYNVCITKDLSLYTPSSTAAFMEAKDILAEAVQAEGIRYEEAQNLVNLMREALDALVKKANKYYLQEVVDAYEVMDLSAYTSASAAEFREMLESAKDVLADEDATQEEVNAAQDALSDMVMKLVYKGDKESLQSAVDTYESWDYSRYTSASAARMRAALEAAKEVLAKEEPTMEEVDAALRALSEIYNALVETIHLQAAVDTYESWDLSEYTSASAAEFSALIEAAKEVLADEDATQEEVDAAKDALNDMAANLVYKADKYYLQVAVERYEALDYSAYTSASVAELRALIEAAKEVLAKEEPTQEEVNAAQNALDDGYYALVRKADKFYLQNAVDTYESWDLSAYTSASAAEFRVVLEAAKEVLAKEEPTQEEVDAALNALNDMAVHLVVKVDKNYLQEVVDTYEAMDLSEYTSASVAEFRALIEAAKEVLANEDATQEEVNAAQNAIGEGYYALVKKAEKYYLQEAVKYFEAMDLSAYTSASAAEFRALIEAAKDVLADKGATQEEVDAALEALHDMAANLVDKADKTGLQAAVDQYEAMDYSAYTSTSVAEFRALIEAAKEVLADEDATQEEVNAAQIALEESYYALVKKANKYFLQANVNAYEALDLSVYTSASAAEFRVVLEAAKEVLVKEEPTQEEVDAALNALHAMYTKLVHKANKANLQSLVNDYENIDDSKYTSESVAEFRAMLEAAKEVLAKEEPTQDEVDAAVEALQAAIDALEELPVEKVLTILKQPVSTAVLTGQDAVASVEADGDGLTYAWYYKNPGNKKFYASNASFENENVYSIPMSAWRNGQEVYCVITDAYGNSVQTNIVTLSTRNATVEIVKQPQDVAVEVAGDTATVTVEATGDIVSYTWYYKNPSNVKFYVSGEQFVSEDGTSYTIPVSAWRDGHQVYCVITDATGASVQTETVTLSIAK